MLTVRDGWTEPTGKAIYAWTGKSPDSPEIGGVEYAYWVLANRIDDEFPGGTSLSNIYHDITGPQFGLSLDETRGILKRAKQAGYIEVKRG